jgi:catechol 2,3-dioxygenase-like lactoylglutathione lyase family enzyme
MNSIPMHAATAAAGVTIPVEMRIEVIVLPVTDIDRAKRFYAALGWNLDIDAATGDDFRIVQFTPPGSACSVMFGKGITNAAPGSVQNLHLVVSDLDAACAALVGHGIDVSAPFHDAGGIFHRTGAEGHVPGPNPQRKSYASYAAFSDPDGNGWVLQEVTARLSADIPPAGETAFTDALANAVRRAIRQES